MSLGQLSIIQLAEARCAPINPMHRRLGTSQLQVHHKICRVASGGENTTTLASLIDRTVVNWSWLCTTAATRYVFRYS